jgi:hypothetical protein
MRCRACAALVANTWGGTATLEHASSGRASMPIVTDFPTHFLDACRIENSTTGQQRKMS